MLIALLTMSVTTYGVGTSNNNSGNGASGGPDPTPELSAEQSSLCQKCEGGITTWQIEAERVCSRTNGTELNNHL